MTLFVLTNEIMRGKDLYRILMNEACSAVELRGKVLDIGGGAGRPSYFRFFKQDGKISITSVDALMEGESRVDFEKDRLPFADASVDTALLLNVLEHVYRYEHLLADTYRVLRKSARLIGVVPFLVNYHPDPRDFWRYTGDSIEQMLKKTGFTGVKIDTFGWGPCTAGFYQIEFLIPRIFRVFAVPSVYILDKILFWFRPELTRRFPLGYFFTAIK